MGIRGSSFTAEVVQHGNKLPGEVVESQFLEGFKKRVDVEVEWT